MHGGVAEMRNVYRILLRKLEGRRELGRPLYIDRRI
jgi:hypothetical protein